MKRLVIVRHAKAVPYGYEDDFNRKLKQSGKDDAATLSSKLKTMGITPDLIISSPAKRAFGTAKIYAKSFDYPKNEIQKEKDLYEGLTTEDFIQMLNLIPDKVDTAFVFGHNPTVHYLTNNLLRVFNSDTPTCSTVGLEFNVDSWTKIAPREGELAFHLKPHHID